MNTDSRSIYSEYGVNANRISKELKFYIARYGSFLKRRSLLNKWRHHADARSFDWDWQSVNFNRIAVVNLLANRFDDPAYLEIGCQSNKLFNSVPVENKTGIDPVSGGNVRATSDEFFSNNVKKFDVVFIDGLHTYDQVRRDVINSMKFLNDGGWIALHDMLPRNWIEEHVPMVSSGAWTGDVWKVAFELIATEGVEFKILKMDYGVGVLRLKNKNAVLADLRDELTTKQFDYYYDNISRLPIIEWPEAAAWIKSQ